MLKQGKGLRDTKAEAKVTGREAERKPYVAQPYAVRPDAMWPYGVRP